MRQGSDHKIVKLHYIQCISFSIIHGVFDMYDSEGKKQLSLSEVYSDCDYC